ncbi:unnamed protein product [Mytilus edulis]|uniref:Uncharacterized protein n=1 Tax=Mytilus edulis TaxID=6550 RepID=A0A8S3RCQ4_MYTED|nr:unnamed protein product [Mytilus edulis]
MWRLYMDNEEDRLSLLVTGLNLRGRQVPLYSQNPRNPGRLQENTIRIKVKNVPLSADDGQIHRALTLQGCDIQDLFREYLRVNGELTACQTGDRVVISKISQNISEKITFSLYALSTMKAVTVVLLLALLFCVAVEVADAHYGCPLNQHKCHIEVQMYWLLRVNGRVYYNRGLQDILEYAQHFY